MKRSAIVLGSSVCLTLLFYLLAYFFLPPPPPTAPMMTLFAGVALVLVLSIQYGIRTLRSKKKPPKAVLLLFSAALLLPFAPRELQAQSQSTGFQKTSTVCHFTDGPLSGKLYDISPEDALPVGSACTDGQGNTGKIVARWSGNEDRLSVDGSVRPDSPSDHTAVHLNGDDAEKSASNPNRDNPPTILPDSRSDSGHIHLDSVDSDQPAAKPSPSNLPRVTGYSLLLHKTMEAQGYGLYSYALLTHAPQDDEIPRYRGFLRALIDLPTATGLEESHLPRARINITYLMVTSLAADWDELSLDKKTDYALAHYDWARSAAIVASLPQKTGRGPVIISTLHPIAVDQSPHPVLVQDLTTAQPKLMAAYVGQFTSQAAKDRFWQARAMETFSLTLGNLLETTAVGLGMSKDAVKSWISFFK